MRTQGFRPDVVIDVGAAHGYWTRSCARLYPNASYVMVEPNPAYRAELQAVGRTLGAKYVAAAAGRAVGALPLLIPSDPTGASFLREAGDEGSYFERSVTVPVVTLDSIAVPGTVSLLKLDVQGYELEALAGAQRQLGEAEVVICECSLHAFQEGIPLVDEIVAFMTATADMRLYDFADQVRWKSGTLAQLDLIFVAAWSPLLGPEWWTST
jgi:FkbM family methyltransferase